MDGILCVDKPPEMTSFLCCSVARRLLGVKKAGPRRHAGSLATGVLPVLTGRATKILPYLPCMTSGIPLRSGWDSSAIRWISGERSAPPA